MVAIAFCDAIFLCLLYFVSAFPAKQENFPMAHHHRSKGVMAPFSFPQLYRCPISPSEISPNNDSRSQNKEDLWLYEKIFSRLPVEEQIGGTFLEIGALDGVTYSNTWFFEKKLGWKGILVE
eukprot:gene32780-39633_t